MPDRAYPDTVDGPAGEFEAVTKSDSTVLTQTRGLYVGGAGDVVVNAAATGSGNVTFSAVPAGTILPVRCRRVMAATTATLIVALR